MSRHFLGMLKLPTIGEIRRDPVARKLWLPIGAAMPAAAARRRINTNGIKFQKSKFIGSGRRTTPDDLLESLESVERYVIVDLRQFPLLRFYPIDSKLLLRLVRQGKLTASGVT